MDIASKIYPAVAMRGIVTFPYAQLNFDVAREASVKAVEEALSADSKIFLVAQKDIDTAEPNQSDLYEVGIVAKITQVMHLPGNATRVIVKGICRATLNDVLEYKPYIKCKVEEMDETYCGLTSTEAAYSRVIKSKFEEYFAINHKLNPDRFAHVMDIEHLGKLCDTVTDIIDFDLRIKQRILSELNYCSRAEYLIYQLNNMIEILEIEQTIMRKAKEKIDENQREYFLREQMHAIEDELGDKDGVGADVESFRERIIKARMSKDNTEKLMKDVERFSKLPSMSQDSGVLRAYLETVLDLPWNKMTKEKFDIKRASKILNEDHYGLEKVKDRILEFLAVRAITKGKNSTVICLEGPPGVGKTSIAKSIARALGRKFVRVSLGGIHDESDIRGHRKTYVGAMEGRIISAIRNSKVKNPVILLDEIDKMGSDYKGDPSAALLEVLDNEQNHEFRDHYIEIPFDLSHVMFITTANTLDTISQPLLDRMEIIRLSGYTDLEKFNIAKDYLIKKARLKTGLNSDQILISDDAITKIIEHYTREAGVRKLEQTFESLCRKAAKEMLENGNQSVIINAENISNYLGKERFKFDLMNEHDEIGIARGLAWTSVGGETLAVEVNVMSGTGKVELTGKLGDVMKESAMAAISYIRSSTDKLKIDDSFHKNKDIHIHVPEGAVPKDGPSAGITMATAVISSLTNKPVRRDVAMTGEITLRGKVLPIGGLKEKSMAAYRAGIRTVIIPEENTPDIDEIPQEIRDEITFIPVNNMDMVIENVFR